MAKGVKKNEQIIISLKFRLLLLVGLEVERVNKSPIGTLAPLRRDDVVERTRKEGHVHPTTPAIQTYEEERQRRMRLLFCPYQERLFQATY
jgi:hypothetical protein